MFKANEPFDVVVDYAVRATPEAPVPVPVDMVRVYVDGVPAGETTVVDGTADGSAVVSFPDGLPKRGVYDITASAFNSGAESAQTEPVELVITARSPLAPTGISFRVRPAA